MKRREFLTSSLAAGVAFGFPALVSARSPNAKVCHACIGTHGMAGADMRTFAGFKDILDVVAVCDVDAAYLAEAKKLLPNARVYRDWRELLAAEGDRIDAVNVSTPDHTHTIVSANAMRRGKHVYCQKPLCKTLDECRLLRRLARSWLPTRSAAKPQSNTIMRTVTLGPAIGPKCWPSLRFTPI